MASRLESAFDAVVAAPWPLGIAAGVFLFWLIRYGAGWLLALSNNMFLKPIGEQLSRGSLAPLAWIALGICWIAAGFSYANRRRHK